jgi:hypothetical protein
MDPGNNLITDLTEEHRKKIEEQIYFVLLSIEQCKSRLETYQAGKTTTLKTMMEVNVLHHETKGLLQLLKRLAAPELNLGEFKRLFALMYMHLFPE